MILLTKMSMLEIGILIGVAVIFTCILIVFIYKKFHKKKPKEDDEEKLDI